MLSVENIQHFRLGFPITVGDLLTQPHYILCVHKKALSVSHVYIEWGFACRLNYLVERH